MIYIISTETLEYTTERVMDWFDAYKVPVVRINGENLNKKDNLLISINNEDNNSIKFDKITNKRKGTAWFRRWGKKSSLLKVDHGDLDSTSLDSLKSLIDRDRNIIKNYTLRNLNIKHWLTDPSLSSMNKLEVLSKASKVGLNIPSTIVCTSKSDLLDFIQKHDRVIVKAISETIGMYDNKYNYTFLTKEIKLNDLPNIPQKFVPTCFQKLIRKEFEIRTFFLNGEFYSMAIFSQFDKTTSVDFRNYNKYKPNRNVPYLLPVEIHSKIKRLMNEIGLNTGSIDFIKDLNGNYIFLEINPVGQFGMVSRPCNYYLEKKVAEYLINEDKKNNIVSDQIPFN